MSISVCRSVLVRSWLALASSLLALALAGPASAVAQGPFWHVTAEASPTYLPPSGEGEIVAVASNHNLVAKWNPRTDIAVRFLDYDDTVLGATNVTFAAAYAGRL